MFFTCFSSKNKKIVKKIGENVIIGEVFCTNIDKLSVNKQSLFALCIAQRLYPHFKYFSKLNNVGNIHSFLNIMYGLWHFHLGQFDKQRLLDLVMDNTVLSEDDCNLMQEHDFQGAPLASDSQACLFVAIKAILQRQEHSALHASNLSFNTLLNMFDNSEYNIYEIINKDINTLSDDEIELYNQIYEDPFIKAEIEFQEMLYQKIKQLDANNKDQIVQLAHFILSFDKTNIGLMVDKEDCDLIIFAKKIRS